MEFHNKLYQLRKQKGLSQEELANRLHVSRQTISKWEIGDSAPDMENLIAISDLFEISLDELVMDKQLSNKADWAEKVLTSDNKRKAKHGLKILGIIFGVIVLIDIISMIVYFSLYGFPQ